MPNAVTFLQAINRVLVKLREDEVSDLTTANSYQKLVAAFVNEAKEDVENAWKWNSLQADGYHGFNTTAGTSTEVLSGVGQEFTIEAVLNSTNNVWMRGPMPNWKINQWANISGSRGTPLWWDISGVDSSDDPIFRFWPAPDGVYSLRVYSRHRQVYLDTATPAHSSTVIRVPWKPVVFGAYYRAVSERGEDGGQIYDESVKAYDVALSDAIALDSTLGHMPTDFHNDDLNLKSDGYIGLP